jgi:outer membrane protein
VEKFKMKKSLLVVALLSAFAPMVAQAEAGDIVVRLRAAYVNPDEKSRLAETVATNVGDVMTAGANLAVGNNTIPELDISYYITKNIAAELILAVGTKHKVSVVGDALNDIGSQDLGKVNLLPPTLTAQWHFNPDQTIDPYIGAGLNYTNALDRKLTFTDGDVTDGYNIRIDRSMFGLVAQAGVDINLGSGWLINADVKYINVNTDVKMRAPGSTGAWTKIDKLDINPWVFGVGIGKKF